MSSAGHTMLESLLNQVSDGRFLLTVVPDEVFKTAGGGIGRAGESEFVTTGMSVKSFKGPGYYVAIVQTPTDTLILCVYAPCADVEALMSKIRETIPSS